MAFEQLTTPSLLLDLARVRRNADEMRQRIHRLGCSLRPHVKTHKCIEVAALQVERPLGPITVSTLAEAQAFVRAGYHDVTYAVPIEPAKFASVICLARECSHFGVLVDDLEVVNALDRSAASAGQSLNVYLKVDCGYHRCGVLPDSPEAASLPARLARAQHLRFQGLLTHAGQSYACRNDADRKRVAVEERDAVADLASRLRSAGIDVPVVSVGSTPTLGAADDLTGVTEARPGNYIFFDGSQAARGVCSLEQCALTVLASVIHRDTAGRRVVIDAGAIALSKDSGVAGQGGLSHYGHVLEEGGTLIGARLSYLAQEHGVFDCPDDYDLAKLRVGTRVRIVPNHSCLTAAQFPGYNVIEQQSVVAYWGIHSHWH